MEQKLGEFHKILDHGYISLIDIMGNDISIVEAARISTNKGSLGEEKDRILIDYLISHGHWSPFEMVETKWRVRLPIFVARQWIRHRTANVNECSGRYSEMIEEFYTPDQNRIRSGAQGTTNRQGSSEGILDNTMVNEVEDGMIADAEQAFIDYRTWIESYSLSRELARINLPLSTYTEWFWKIDLRNLLHFLNLRTHPHAQWEIRQYANKMLEIIEPFVPWTIAAWKEHIRNSKTIPESKASELVNLAREWYRPIDGIDPLADKVIELLDH